MHLRTHAEHAALGRAHHRAHLARLLTLEASIIAHIVGIAACAGWLALFGFAVVESF